MNDEIPDRLKSTLQRLLDKYSILDSVRISSDLIELMKREGWDDDKRTLVCSALGLGMGTLFRLRETIESIPTDQMVRDVEDAVREVRTEEEDFGTPPTRTVN